MGLLFFLLIFLASCGPDAQHGRVKGKFSGINEADIIAFVDDSVGSNPGAADTIHIKRGSFTYDRPVGGPTILTLLYPNFSSTSFVVEPGKTVTVKGDANRLSEIEVDGNDDNILLTEFQKHVNGKRDAEVRREAATFIRSHPSALASVVLFRDHFSNSEVIESNPTESLLATLQKAQPQSASVRCLASRLQPLLRTAPGKSLPDFTAPAIDGGTISSATYRGRNLLIVFCAQWDGSFYPIKRCASALLAAVPANGLTLLFISLDPQREAFLTANSVEPLPGAVIYDGLSFSSPLVSRLGMRYVGGSLLVGTDGRILARDIPTDEWATRIPPLLR